MGRRATSTEAVSLRWAIGGGLAALVAIGAWLLAAAIRIDPIPAEAYSGPSFVEEASSAGIDHSYDGDFHYFVGGGVAVFDCDDDLRPDLFFAGGANPAALFRNSGAVGGKLEFEKVAAFAGQLLRVTGAYPIDVDGDSVLDLAVLRYGENLMLRGLGNCEFEYANDDWAVDGGNDWTVGFSATWETENRPTLAFGNYLEMVAEGEQESACGRSFLIRPGPEGFYQKPSPLEPGYCALSVLFSDWNRSGSADLRVSNDRHYYRDGQEQLWNIGPDDAPRLYTADEGWQSLKINGMGIASQDVTGDGYPEFYLTSQGDNKLQTLAEGPAQPMFEDVAIRRGVTIHRPFIEPNVHPSTAWHPVFNDVNNDGFVDLYVSKGNVEEQEGFALDDPNNLLLGQADGTFVEHAQAAGIVNLERTRGGALVDLNADGMLDLIEVNRRANVTLWRNVGWGNAESPDPMGNWSAIKISQSGANTNAIGAWLELRVGDHVMSREITIGGGHAGGHVGWIHFGLGKARSAELSIRWPDQTVDVYEVASGRFSVIDKGSSDVSEWSP